MYKWQAILQQIMKENRQLVSYLVRKRTLTHVSQNTKIIQRSTYKRLSPSALKLTLVIAVLAAGGGIVTKMSLEQSPACHHCSCTARAELVLAQHAVLEADIWRRCLQSKRMGLHVILENERCSQGDRLLEDKSTTASAHKDTTMILDLLVRSVNRVKHLLPAALAKWK